MRLFEESRTKTDSEAIVEKAQSLLHFARVNSAPVPLRVLASYQNIAKIEELDMKPAGMLVPEGAALSIYLRKSDSKHRKNFTCCHEIAHTLLDDFQEKPQKRIDYETALFHHNDKVELLCDIAASELLLPTHIVNQHMDGHGFNLNSLKVIAEVFQASLQATARKLVDMNPNNHAMILWDFMHKPREGGALATQPLSGFESHTVQKKLRILYGYGRDTFFPPYKSLKESGSVINDCLKSGYETEGEESINIGNTYITGKVMAMPLHSENYGKVLTLIDCS